MDDVGMYLDEELKKDNFEEYFSDGELSDFNVHSSSEESSDNSSDTESDDDFPFDDSESSFPDSEESETDGDLCLSLLHTKNIKVSNVLVMEQPTPTVAEEQASASSTHVHNDSQELNLGLDPKSYEMWTKVQPPEKEETRPRPKFTVNSSGPINCQAEHDDPLHYFHLFFTDELFMGLVTETNTYANKFIACLKSNPRFSSVLGLTHWVDVTLEEIKIFFAIMIQCGIIRMSTMEIFWDERFGVGLRFLANMMSQQRFQLIWLMFRVSNCQSSPKKTQENDPFFKIQPFLSHMNNTFKQYFVPSQDICIDECFIGMKRHRTYIHYVPPTLSVGHGLKKFEVCDASTRYVLHVALYSGTDTKVKGSEPFVHNAIKNLMNELKLLGKWHHLFTENIYENISLPLWLLENKTLITSSVIPSKELSKTVQNPLVEIGQSLSFRKGPILLIGHKEYKHGKPWCFISTGCNAEECEETNKKGEKVKKPLAVQLYQNHRFVRKKGRLVDRKDKEDFHLTCTRPSKTFWRTAVLSIIDTAILNAYILYAVNTKDRPMDRFKFLEKIMFYLAGKDSVSDVDDEDEEMEDDEISDVEQFEDMPQPESYGG